MRNHKKLYRSITASLLMLLAGLVLAPTVVTASFLASAKKPEAPAVQQVALEPTTLKAVPRPQSTRFAEPTLPGAPAAQGQDEQPVPQAETESMSADQHDNVGPTTFAFSDFEPTHGGAVFPRGAVGVAIADAGGSNISKVVRKPNSPQTETSDAGKSPSDTAGAPANTPAAGGDQKDQPVADGGQPSSPPPSNGLIGNSDNHDSRPHASVPEPSSLGLLALGMVGLALARRRA